MIITRILRVLTILILARIFSLIFLFETYRYLPHLPQMQKMFVASLMNFGTFIFWKFNFYDRISKTLSNNPFHRMYYHSYVREYGDDIYPR